MGKVSKEIADQEIISWMDYKKIPASSRESEALKNSIETLSEAIQEGILTLDEETFKFKQTLLFEIGEEAKITELVYHPRLNDKMLKPHLSGVKGNDGDGRLLAHIAALTNKPKAVLELLDTVDKRTAQALAIFFL